MAVFEIASLRGGLDDTSPRISMAEDSCVTAENVEFVNTMLGERRKGCVAIDLPASFAVGNLDAVTWMYRHLPVNDEGEAELWALAQSLTLPIYTLSKRDISGWTDITPEDAIDISGTQGHRISAQTLHSKLFLGYKSSQDRLHVYDGTNLRRVGLAEPAAPTVANTGVGTFATTRYYRVRYTAQSGGVTVRRSEPSDSTTFVPSGTGSAARITKPAAINEHETHWEVEASLDNANFYVIATVIVGTTTYDDSISAGVGYDTFDLSEDIGDYTLIPSGKYLSADEDRLLIAGSWEDPDEASRVRWTPVFADPGVGNDERMALDTDPFLDLDGYEGGEITGMSRSVNGYIFVFKRGHIYRLVRTNNRSASYEATCLTKARGALPGSLVEATNQAGQPSLYFLDPSVGPTRLSDNGLQWCGRDIQTLWKRVNVNAAVPCHGVYYNNNRQLHYWVAVDGADYPNFKIVLHVNEVRDTEEGARRGWVTGGKNDRICTAHCSVMFSSNIDDTGDDRSFTLVPFIGKESWVVSGNTIIDYIQRCDTGGTDAYTTGDTIALYRATVTSKPFALAGILNQHAILSGAILLTSETSPTGMVYIQAIRDFGEEVKEVSAQFWTEGDESHVIVAVDDLRFSELYAVQISMGDLNTNVDPPIAWGIDLLQLKTSSGNTA
jgi:hypothetical protein